MVGKRAFLGSTTLVAMSLLLLVVLAGCGSSGSGSGSSRGSGPVPPGDAGGSSPGTVQGGGARPELLLFTSPG